MAWSQKELNVTTCYPADVNTFSSADNSGAGVAVKIGGGGDSNIPFPRVVKADGTAIYGVLDNYDDSDPNNLRAGVITGGIVGVRAGTAADNTNIGFGIVADATAGEVKVGASGVGRGVIVGFDNSDSANPVIFVDLDMRPLA